MKKLLIFFLACFFAFSAAYAEEKESIELSEYFGKPLADAAAVLPSIEEETDELTLCTEAEDIYLSANEQTELVDFIYLSANEGFTLCGIAPGMTLDDVMLIFAIAELNVDDADYENDGTVFAVTDDFSLSITAEFDNGICIAVSSILYVEQPTE